MNLIERFNKSKFLSESSVPQEEINRKKLALALAEFSAIAYLSFNYVLPIDNGHLLPSVLKNRMHDFMGPICWGALTRLSPSRKKAMLLSFGFNASWELGSLIESNMRSLAEPYFGTTKNFLGTYDSGDMMAIACGTVAFGVIDYVRSRGSEYIKRYDAPVNYEQYLHKKDSRISI